MTRLSESTSRCSAPPWRAASPPRAPRASPWCSSTRSSPSRSPDPARYERFVEIVDEVGAKDRVPVLSRYAMMKSLGAKGAKTLGSLLSRDGLHMSDLGYRCLAHALATAIEGAAEAKL